MLGQALTSLQPSHAAELQVAIGPLGFLHSFPSLKLVASGDVSGVALQKDDL